MLAVMPAIEELAQRGHEVTVISPFKGIGNKVKNGNEIFLSEIAKEMDKSDIDWFAMQKQGSTQFFTMLYYIKEISMRACDSLLNNPEFREIVAKRDVDLFIVDGMFHEFLYPIFDLIGVPFVTHSSSSAFPSTLVAMGAPIDYASVPLPTLDADDSMTFTQRLMNIIPNEIMGLLLNHYVKNDLEALVKSHFPDSRSIAELEGDASICIINSHPMTSWPRSLPPTMVPIGALHTRPAKSLPEVIR
jgi:glucuronosyltransferase